jgi:hypothetical protein
MDEAKCITQIELSFREERVQNLLVTTVGFEKCAADDRAAKSGRQVIERCHIAALLQQKGHHV